MIRAAGSKNLGFTGHADLERWEESAKSVLKLSPKTVVPGHGSIGGIDFIAETIQLVSTARKKMRLK